MGLLLSACGGNNSGSIVSTPPPPTYKTLDQLSGVDHTYQSGGVTYQIDSGSSYSSPSTQAFGSGVTIQYTAASDSYQLTAPDGTTASFDPSDAVQSQTPGTQSWEKTSSGVTDIFGLSVPSVNGIPLSYTLFGGWAHTANGVTTARRIVGGVPTIGSDMPKTGTATYDAVVDGSASILGQHYTLAGTSSATFSADFAAGTVTTQILLGGTPVGGGTAVDFGTVDGTGTIAANGPGFTGTLTSGSRSGTFSGVFNGPQAAEMGYAWYLSGSDFSAAGAVLGRKN